MSVSVEKFERILCVQKIYIWNPATCCCKYDKYLGSIIDYSVLISHEILEKLNKNCFNKKYSNQVLYAVYLFINYYSIIDSCYYLLWPHEISSKTQPSVAISQHR